MLYYIEVNATCILVLVIFLLDMRQNGGNHSTDQSILKQLIWATMVFCVSDMAAGVLRGRCFPGARGLIELSNLLYMEALLVISVLWSMYVRVRLLPVGSRPQLWTAARLAPAVLFTLVALTNPWTHFLFTVDQCNLYRRGPGVILHWVVSWSYFLVPTLRALSSYLKEKQSLKRQEIAPMLYFALAPTVASILQMVFYGVTSAQVGITVSVVLICLAIQNAQVLTDALTGINNRRGLERYLADIIRSGSGTAFMLAMIDIDDFKGINDRHGHMVGDQVLKDVAGAIKQACKVMPTRLFICRFGGDEFVIFGAGRDGDDAQRLRSAIEAEIETRIKASGLPENLSVSMGAACGPLADEHGFRELLLRADEAMYAEKAHKRESLR